MNLHRYAGPVVAVAAVVLFVLVLTQMEYGEDFRDATVNAACQVTGCSGPGIALIGFLMTLSPFLYAGALVLWWRRTPIAGRVILVLAGALLAIAMVMFLPSRRRGLDELVDGAGAEALVRGMNWGVLSVFAAVVVGVLAGIASSRIRVRPLPVWTAVGLVVGTLLIIAMTGAPAGHPVASQIFPETTLRVNGDTLTRQWSEDREGCDRILADPAPLRRCLWTAEFQFTTSDSDAVVRFSAVMFADNDAVRDAENGIRERARPAGIDGDALLVTDATGTWLTVAAVRHADGRAIVEADQRWLRWPAAQLRYAFAQATGYSIAPLPTPTTSVGPSSAP